MKTNLKIADKKICIIQARLGATRLPGKVLLELNGRPILEWVAKRVLKAKTIDKLVVATSTEKTDDPLEEFCRTKGWNCFRGSENNVLDRYYQCLQHYQDCRTVIRITADCPLIDPEVIDQTVELFFQEGCDYASNVEPLSFPDGFDVEVFSAEVLKKVWESAQDDYSREHVTSYIKDNRQRFKISGLVNDQDLSDLRLTIDYQEDFLFLSKLLEFLPKDFRLQDIFRVLATHSEFKKINKKYSAHGGWKNHLEKGRFQKTNDFFQQANKVIPLASQTFSKSYLQFVKGAAPLFLTAGRGCRVWDLDGNEYLDFINGLLSVILGYQYPAVDRAIKEQLAKGINFSLPSTLEYQLAERLVELIPCAEMVRFGKNGSDATSGAVRLARAITGRDELVFSGYHGWHDWSIGLTDKNLGVPSTVRKLSHKFEYNNLESLEKIFQENPNKVAAVIMEPINYQEPNPGFLEAVKELTHRNGALLIFDEIITGFRFSLGGAQELFQVTPDLAAFGKSLANGMPISALVGRREFFEKIEDIFFSFTFGGENLSLAAALATLKELQSRNVVPYIQALGGYLKKQTEKIIADSGLGEVIKVKGRSAWQIIDFSDFADCSGLEIKSYFQQELLKRGILWYGQHNLSFSHSKEDLDKLLAGYRDIFPAAKELLDSGRLKENLAGPPISDIFQIRKT